MSPGSLDNGRFFSSCPYLFPRSVDTCDHFFTSGTFPFAPWLPTPGCGWEFLSPSGFHSSAITLNSVLPGLHPQCTALHSLSGLFCNLDIAFQSPHPPSPISAAPPGHLPGIRFNRLNEILVCNPHLRHFPCGLWNPSCHLPNLLLDSSPEFASVWSDLG